MFCESCGSFIPDGQSFCSNCGAPASQPAAQPVSQPVAAAQPVQPVAQPVQPIAAQPVQPVAQPVQPVYQQPVYQQPVYAQPVYQQQPAAPVKKGNGAATAGLVFGILTLCFCWIPAFNIFTTAIFGLLGLIFSIVGIVKKNAGGKGKGIAGLIMTLLGTIGTIIFYIFIVSAFANSTEGGELAEAWQELMEEYDDTTYYSTSYSGADFDDDVNIVFPEDGYATVENGGTLHIDGYIVEF